MSVFTTAVEARGAPPDLPTGELDFHFLAGRPALDFVATIGERWRRAFERLRTPDDLARWSVEAGLVAATPAATDDDLAAARRLRTAIARTLFAWAAGRALPAGDVATINHAAAAPDPAPQLDPVTGRRATSAATASQALAAVARDAIDLIAEGEPDRLRECAANDCSLLFYDTSRPGARRWCSMRTCGNRHKIAAHRARAR